MAIVAALYPPDHPYHWLTIGDGRRSARPRSSTTCARSSRRYYHPANASLAIAGDIDADAALALAERLLRRDSGGESPAPVDRAPPAPAAADCGWCSRIASSCRASTWRGTRRRCSPRATPSSISSADVLAERQDVAAVSRAGLRAAHRHRGLGVAELARDRRLLPDRRDRRARPHARRARARDRRGDRAARRPRPDRRRDGARPGAGGSAVHVPAADGRRIRRQVRSAERLQHVPRRSRLLRRRISRAIAAATPSQLRAGRRAVAQPDAPRRRSASSRAAAPRWRSPGSQPVAVS